MLILMMNFEIYIACVILSCGYEYSIRGIHTSDLKVLKEKLEQEVKKSFPVYPFCTFETLTIAFNPESF